MLLKIHLHIIYEEETMKGVFIMATKSSSVYARIDPDIKLQAENILSGLGISTSCAIDIFFRQIVLHKGLPFEVKFPYEKPIIVSSLTPEELNTEIQKGYEDILAGRTKMIDEAITDMQKDFQL